MTLSSEEAAKTLSQAEDARKRSAELYFYHRSSPHLILWGTIWVIGYGGTGLFPAYSGYLWDALVLIGVASGVVIGRCRSGQGSTAGPRAWRLAALAAIIIFFVSATYRIMQPHYSLQFCAYPALITGSAYMAVGLWSGLRYVVAGVAVVALTLFGFYFIEPHLYFFWMAVVGGGSMILAGLWFRTV
ncbi:MAG: hypothetical protein P4L57_14315 [Rhizomicrobium sp.]|nr:hypothetical protein [Rhizomicrobium sp.]